MRLIKFVKDHLFVFLVLLTLFSCHSGSSRKAGMAWSVYLQGIGTFSSSRVADLNQDGVLDIVMGAGGRENSPSDTAIIALDGATGQFLWRAAGENQFVGSAVFQDINQDEIPDVFIGGRWAELVALNGADGKVLWKFFPQRTQPDPADSGWFNFSTPQFIPDQDQDGLEDLLIANGGNPLVPPNDPNRPAGRLLVLSSRSGKVLADVQVPDGKETYMSVVCKEAGNDGNLAVLFGTGGETIGGSLFRTTLHAIMRGDISGAKALATSEQKGFIGPPVFVDITLDGIDDIVVNAVDGRMLAIDGANDALLWEVRFPGTEAYTSPAVGYFNGDSVPDFFTNYGIGTYPNLSESMLFMVDGKTGNVEYQILVQGFQYACPVVADLNGDGYDGAIINKTEARWKNNEDLYYSYLVSFDFKNNRQFIIGDTLRGSNLASTPWIGDLNQDGYLDIVYSAVKYKGLVLNEELPRGLYIARYKTGYKMTKPPVWGAYMGTDYTGVFRSSARSSMNRLGPPAGYKILERE